MSAAETAQRLFPVPEAPADETAMELAALQSVLGALAELREAGHRGAAIRVLNHAYSWLHAPSPGGP